MDAPNQEQVPLRENPLWRSLALLIDRTNRSTRQIHDFVHFPGERKRTPVVKVKTQDKTGAFESIVSAKRKILGEITRDDNPDLVGLHVEDSEGDVTMMCWLGGRIRITGNSEGFTTLVPMDPVDRVKAQPITQDQLELPICDIRSLSPVTQDGLKRVVDRAINSLRK